MPQFQFEFDIVAIMVLSLGVIYSHLRTKIKVENLENKQKEDHQFLLKMQSNKEKALWEEIKTLRETMLNVVQALGRVEGKIDAIKKP